MCNGTQYVLMQYLILVYVFFLGATFGSFANAWAYRHVRGLSVWKGRSHCPACNQTLPWYVNIPVFSYLWLRGACFLCGAPVSFRYFFAECVCGLWFLLFFHAFGVNAATFVYCGAAVLLLVLSLIDVEKMLLPDPITLLLTAWVFGGGWFAGFSLSGMATGAIAGSVGLWCVGAGYSLLRKRAGLGFGDVKLMFPLGALVGVWGLPMMLLISSLLGILCACFGLVKATHSFSSLRIPFGPFLSVGAGVYVLYGHSLYALLWTIL